MSINPQVSYENMLDGLSTFYFDTALSSSPTALPSLLKFARPGHVLFGSDWPYCMDKTVTFFADALDGYDGFGRRRACGDQPPQRRDTSTETGSTPVGYGVGRPTASEITTKARVLMDQRTRPSGHHRQAWRALRSG